MTDEKDGRRTAEASTCTCEDTNGNGVVRADTCPVHDRERPASAPNIDRVKAAAERFLKRRPLVVDPTVVPSRAGREVTAEDLWWFVESLCDEGEYCRASAQPERLPDVVEGHPEGAHAFACGHCGTTNRVRVSSNAPHYAVPALPINEDDERMLDRLMRESSPSPTRPLKRDDSKASFRGKLQCILGLQGREVSDDELLDAVRGTARKEVKERLLAGEDDE